MTSRAMTSLHKLVAFLCNPHLLVLLVALCTCANIAHARPEPISSFSESRPPTYSNLGRGGDETEQQQPGALPYSFFSGGYRTGGSDSSNNALRQICEDGYFTARIVNCVRTVIDGAVGDFLDKFQLALHGFILALITLAVTLFGGKILMGSVDRPGPEAFTLLLKIGAVLLFTNTLTAVGGDSRLGGLLPMLFPVMESLAGYGMSYIGSGDSSILLQSCSEANGFDGPIWNKVDCIVQRLLTGGDGFNTGVLWVLAVAILWTNIFGILVFFVMLSVFAMILMLVIRCVYVFLAAYAFLALLTIISPLIIPLALFKNTEQYFKKWWRHFLSMMIQPMLLFAYMAFVFAMIDSMFFQDNEYSLSSILGIQWEDPRIMEGMSDDDIEEKMAEYEEETGYGSGTEEYQGREDYLRTNKTYLGVGQVNFVPTPLIDININPAQNLVESSFLGDTPVVGGYLEEGAGAVATVTDKVLDWAFDKLSGRLVPFEVIRVRLQPGDDGDAPRIMTLLWDLLKFFVVILVMMPLMIKFTKDIPRMIQSLSSAIRTPGSVMPGEKQVMGTIGAVKGGTTGAVKGAAVGFVTGGKAGAIQGGVEGGARGAASGYKRAAGEYGGKRHGGGLAGSEHKNNSMSKEGGETQRKVLHGQGGGGGIASRGIGAGKGALKEAAMQALTRGKGGKGGGGAAGGGKGGGSVKR